MDDVEKTPAHDGKEWQEITSKWCASHPRSPRDRPVNRHDDELSGAARNGHATMIAGDQSTDGSRPDEITLSCPLPEVRQLLGKSTVSFVCGR